MAAAYLRRLTAAVLLSAIAAAGVDTVAPAAVLPEDLRVSKCGANGASQSVALVDLLSHLLDRGVLVNTFDPYSPSSMGQVQQLQRMFASAYRKHVVILHVAVGGSTTDDNLCSTMAKNLRWEHQMGLDVDGVPNLVVSEVSNLQLASARSHMADSLADLEFLGARVDDMFLFAKPGQLGESRRLFRYLPREMNDVGDSVTRGFVERAIAEFGALSDSPDKTMTGVGSEYYRPGEWVVQSGAGVGALPKLGEPIIPAFDYQQDRAKIVAQCQRVCEQDRPGCAGFVLWGERRCSFYGGVPQAMHKHRYHCRMCELYERKAMHDVLLGRSVLSTILISLLIFGGGFAGFRYLHHKAKRAHAEEQAMGGYEMRSYDDEEPADDDDESAEQGRAGFSRGAAE